MHRNMLSRQLLYVACVAIMLGLDVADAAHFLKRSTKPPWHMNEEELKTWRQEPGAYPEPCSNDREWTVAAVMFFAVGCAFVFVYEFLATSARAQRDPNAFYDEFGNQFGCFFWWTYLFGAFWLKIATTSAKWVSWPVSGSFCEYAALALLAGGFLLHLVLGCRRKLVSVPATADQ